MDTKLEKTVEAIKSLSHRINVQSAVETIWNEDLEYFWIGLDLCDKFNFNTPVMDDGDSEQNISFFYFFNNISDKMTDDEIDDLALMCSQDTWNYFFRLILNGKLKETLPMMEIAQIINQLTTKSK